MTLTPDETAVMDDLHVAAEKNLDENIAMARTIVADFPGVHESAAALDAWMEDLDDEDRAAILPLLMLRVVKLTNELEADRIGWEQDRAELAHLREEVRHWVPGRTGYGGGSLSMKAATADLPETPPEARDRDAAVLGEREEDL